VYQGQSPILSDIATWKTGDTKLFPAFTSTLLQKGVANSFAQGGIIFMIFLPMNFGRNLAQFSEYPGEDEILLPAFSTLKVVNVKPSEGGIQWEAKLLCLGYQPEQQIPIVSTHTYFDAKAIHKALLTATRIFFSSFVTSSHP
jgi:hypothetical protein